MTRSALTCAICHQPLRATRYGLVHVDRSTKANDHNPIVEETVDETAQEARG